MKYILLILTALILTGCSTEYYIPESKKSECEAMILKLIEEGMRSQSARYTAHTTYGVPYDSCSMKMLDTSKHDNLSNEINGTTKSVETIKTVPFAQVSTIPTKPTKSYNDIKINNRLDTIESNIQLLMDKVNALE